MGECQMTKEAQSPNDEMALAVAGSVSVFDIRHLEPPAIICLRPLAQQLGWRHQPLLTMQTHAIPDTKSNRRSFLRTAGLGLSALGFSSQAAIAAGQPSASSAKPSKIRLGTVTYN